MQVVFGAALFDGDNCVSFSSLRVDVTHHAAGGGGGAGAAGENATADSGGTGGAGVPNSITGAVVHYGGGGGGGASGFIEPLEPSWTAEIDYLIVAGGGGGGCDGGGGGGGGGLITSYAGAASTGDGRRRTQQSTEIDNCYEATETGTYTVHGVFTYCDTETAGGGWELFLHTDTGKIPGPLTAAAGSFVPVERTGQAHTALADTIAGISQGGVEIAIAWGDVRRGKVSHYQKAVSFALPIPCSGNTFAPAANGNSYCENDGYAATTITCLSSGEDSCGAFRTGKTVYTGSRNFGACYGHAYGIVAPNAGNSQCDWVTGGQGFSTGLAGQPQFHHLEPPRDTVQSMCHTTGIMGAGMCTMAQVCQHSTMR